MALGKQAKILTEKQQEIILAYFAGSRDPSRNTVMFLLSVDAGLRAKEIASLQWQMLTDAQGAVTDVITLPNTASKGKSGGAVDMSKRLFKAVSEHYRGSCKTGSVIAGRNGKGTTPQVVTNWFFNLYRKLGYEGCSSHSGRRTAITRWARKISSVGGSLRDVQALARHSSLSMTQRYIDVCEDACRKVVG